jgi:hypothetical protein
MSKVSTSNLTQRQIKIKNYKGKNFNRKSGLKFGPKGEFTGNCHFQVKNIKITAFKFLKFPMKNSEKIENSISGMNKRIFIEVNF